MTQHIRIDNYHSRVRGLRDFCFGGTITVYRAGPDGKPVELLRTETPQGKANIPKIKKVRD